MLQPEKVRDGTLARELASLRPDLLAVAAYGRILGKDLLELAPHGAINVHGSLLPKYRGAAPIQWAIAEGEAETGVSIMRMDEGLDTGDVLLQRVLPIGPDDTSETLAPRLAALGGEALVEALALLPEGALVPVRQDETRATLARILAKEDGRVDFAWSARRIRDRLRAFTPWPGAMTTLDGRTVKLLEAVEDSRRKRAAGRARRGGRRAGARPRGALRRRDRAPRHPPAARGEAPAGGGGLRERPPPPQLHVRHMTARKLAFDVLRRVDEGGAYASRALDAALAGAGALDPREAGLATELVYGTLRRALSLDAALAPHSRRPVDALDPAARVALRLGAYQLLFLGKPAHAAVGETVSLVKAVDHGRASGYVNAVLRALARAPRLPEPPPLAVDPAGHVAVAEALPRWLAEEWVAWLGPDEALALARGMNQPAALTVRSPGRDALLARARAAGLSAEPTPRSPDGVVLAGTSVAELARAAGGLPFQVQDEAAQLVTLYAAGALRGKRARVLDACAAPGGKAFHLAELLAPGSEIVAIELHPRKAEELAREAARRSLRRRARHLRRRHPSDPRPRARLVRRGPRGRAVRRPRHPPAAPGAEAAAHSRGPRPDGRAAGGRPLEHLALRTAGRARDLLDLLALPRGRAVGRRGCAPRRARARDGRRGAGGRAHAGRQSAHRAPPPRHRRVLRRAARAVSRGPSCRAAGSPHAARSRVDCPAP